MTRPFEHLFDWHWPLRFLARPRAYDVDREGVVFEIERPFRMVNLAFARALADRLSEVRE